MKGIHLKALGVVLLISGALYFFWCQYKSVLIQGSRPSMGMLKLKEMEQKGVPDFSVLDVDGDRISLSQFKDKVVIVNFWASWCDPCVDEFPSMVELISHFKGNVVLLAVSSDDSLEEIKNFLKVFEVFNPYIKVLWDKEKVIAQRYGTQVLPESYILGRDHQLKRKIVGVDQWYTRESIAFFEALVKENL